MPSIPGNPNVIGGSSLYSTWAVLRTAIDNASLGGSGRDQYDHNIEYIKGFYSSNGNGFIRTSYTPQLVIAQPSFNLDGSGTFWSPNADINFIWTDEDRDQLIGETVTNAGVDFIINADAFDNYPTWQVTSGVDPIYTIGKLTAF
jgi:hypothetical protein